MDIQYDLSSLDIYDELSDNELLDIICELDIGQDLNNEKEKEMENTCKCDNAENVVNDIKNGVKVCKSCGLVVGGILDENAEWRSYDNYGGPTASQRCTIAINPHLPRSSIGTSISGKFRSKIKILHDWGAMPYEERSLNNVLKKIQKKCRDGSILKCIEDDAKIMYKYINCSVHKDGKSKGNKIIVRGDNRKSLIAACVFFACIRKGQPRNITEVAELFDLTYTDMTTGLKLFTKLIRTTTSRRTKTDFKIGTSLPEEFMPRYCKKLKFRNKYEFLATTIAKNVNKLNMASTHNPISITVGILWLIIEKEALPITKKHLSRTFKISEVTVSKACNILKPRYNILRDNEKTDTILELLGKQRILLKLPVKLEIHNKSLKSDIKMNIKEYTKEIDNLIKPDNQNKINEKYDKLILFN